MTTGSVIVEQGQSLLNIAVQHCGSIMAAVDIAVLNGLSITDELIPSTALKLPEVVSENVVSYLQQNNYIPATGLTQDEDFEGIDYNIISLTFKVYGEDEVKLEGIGHNIIEADFIVYTSVIEEEGIDFDIIGMTFKVYE